MEELIAAVKQLLYALHKGLGVGVLSKDFLRWECPECKQVTCAPNCKIGIILRAADKCEAVIARLDALKMNGRWLWWPNRSQKVLGRK